MNSNQPIRELFKLNISSLFTFMGKILVCLDPSSVPLTQLNPDPKPCSKDDTDRVNANKLDWR
jgi:hypothetical protein